jgi:ABC-2 type transport system ATP-binding protein
VTAEEETVSARLGDHKPDVINAELVGADIPVSGLETVRPSLEDLFVQLTGEGFNVNG